MTTWEKDPKDNKKRESCQDNSRQFKLKKMNEKLFIMLPDNVWQSFSALRLPAFNFSSDHCCGSLWWYFWNRGFLFEFIQSFSFAGFGLPFPFILADLILFIALNKCKFPRISRGFSRCWIVIGYFGFFGLAVMFVAYRETNKIVWMKGNGKAKTVLARENVFRCMFLCAVLLL